MANLGRSGEMKYVDIDGTVYVLYPVTLRENILGMEDVDTHVESKENPHEVTPEQIKAVPLTAAGLTALMSKGPMVMTENVHYGTEFPANAVKGQLFLKKV